MKYLDLINQFWEKHNAVLYKPSEIALYFYLLDSCNKGRWKNPFQVTARQLILLGLSEDTITRAKRELKNTGLIDFKTIKGSKNTTFELLNLPKIAGSSAVGSAVSFAGGLPSTPYIVEEEEVKKHFTEVTGVNGEYSEKFAADFVTHYNKRGWPDNWKDAMSKNWLTQDFRKKQIEEIRLTVSRKNKPYF